LLFYVDELEIRSSARKNHRTGPAGVHPLRLRLMHHALPEVRASNTPGLLGRACPPRRPALITSAIARREKAPYPAGDRSLQFKLNHGTLPPGKTPILVVFDAQVRQAFVQERSPDLQPQILEKILPDPNTCKAR